MTTPHPIQRLALLAIVAIGAIVALSSLPGLWISLAGHEGWGIGPQPLVAGFEAITFTAGGFAVWMGLRYRPQGFGLGVLCVAGAVFVGGVLGAKMLESSGTEVPSLNRYMALRVLLALALTAMAGLVKLGPRQDCWRTLTMGAALLMPIAGVGALVVLRRTALLTGPIGGLPEIAQIVVWLVLAIIVGILTVWGGHLVIRAFEMTRSAKPGEPEAE